MSNPSFVKDRIKIGKSGSDPDEYRKDELDGTGIPTPFKVEYKASVVDYHRIERSLHRTFFYARANDRREFFDVPTKKVIDEIRKIADIIFEVNNCAEAKAQTLTCVKCSTSFPILDDSKEQQAHCPECFQLHWTRYNFVTEQFELWDTEKQFEQNKLDTWKPLFSIESNCVLVPFEKIKKLYPKAPTITHEKLEGEWAIIPKIKEVMSDADDISLEKFAEYISNICQEEKVLQHDD